MATLTSAVIEIIIGGTVIIYGEGSTPVITQELTDEQNTVLSNAGLKDELSYKIDESKLLLTNLLNNDISSFFLDKRLSANGGNLTSNDGFKSITTCKPIKVYKNEYYSVSGSLHIYNNGTRGLITPDYELSQQHYAPSWEQINGGFRFLSPIDGYFVADFDLNSDLSALEKESQVEQGDSVSQYISFGSTGEIKNQFTKTLNQDVDNVASDLKEFQEEVIVLISKNKINPTQIDYTRRYSPGGKSIVASTGTAYALYTIFLDEGQYTLSPEMPNSSSGGFFANESDIYAIDNIPFVQPVIGNGATFDVPEGGLWVKINIRLTGIGSGTPMHDYQLEEGEIPTEYEPYNPIPQVNPSLLPKQEKPRDSTILDKYTTFDLNTPLDGKLPRFVQSCIDKNKDVCVGKNGTSIPARTIEHCTEHVNAKFRPPLMHSNNIATHIWDALHKLWGNVQQYRRYDSGFFEETGEWNTSYNLAEWDDGAYRNGLTRYSTDEGASISCVAPIGAWQFNLIFRTDTLASETIRIDIAEGNGIAQVWDESTQRYVEMNGYIFSQREDPVTILPSITFNHPDTEIPTTINDYQVKGNTTYQKRLKGRFKGEGFDSRNIEKHITYTNIGTGKMTYWGAEWSSREFMITYINAARGSHSSAIGSASSSLTHYIDNELLSFKPDLILSDDAIHNAGASGIPSSIHPSEYYGRVVENFFLADNPVSIKQRCIDLGLNVPEFMLFNSSIAFNFGGIDDEGNLKTGITKDGKMWTALDSQMSCWRYISEKYPEVKYINVVKHWFDCGFDAFGDMHSATIGSGKDGKTLTNEGSHPNDTGCKVFDRPIVAALTLYN